MQKVNKVRYEPEVVLQYLSNDATEEYSPDGENEKVIVQIERTDKEGNKHLIISSDLRKIEVKYGWDKTKRETSSDPTKRLRVRQQTASLIVKEISGFDDWTLSDLVEEDRDFFDDIMEVYNRLIKAQEVMGSEAKGKTPFYCEVNYMSQTDQGHFVNRYLRPRGDYDPGTTPGEEGENDLKYQKATARKIIGSFGGLYDAQGEEITYDSDNPDYNVLQDFIELNP